MLSYITRHQELSCVFFLFLSLSIPAVDLPADVFFEDDFEIYFDDADLVDEGWRVVEVANPIATTPFWTVMNPGGRGTPPGEDGAPGAGNFLMSVSCLLYTSPSPRDYGESRMPGCG